jgi:hypothetical protein
MPVTKPPVPIVATVVLLLAHEPPLVPSRRVIDDPAHIEEEPVIETGEEWTVRVVVIRHPVDRL